MLYWEFGEEYELPLRVVEVSEVQVQLLKLTVPAKCVHRSVSVGIECREDPIGDEALLRESKSLPSYASLISTLSTVLALME